MGSATPGTLNVDVAIMGGGLAGNLLARQLRLYVPNASVAVFERSHERSWKVGEATVEITGNYFARRLLLSTYLYENHLPKNGLRFFFDNAEKNMPLTEMSELGTHSLPFIPSFQIDRARLERDLLVMNKDAGVQVFMGYAARDLQLSADGGRHEFTAVGEHDSVKVSARWCIDAAGRTSLIARQKDLHFPVDHETTAAWARFKNVFDMDAHPDEAWRAKMRHTARYLSTVHFCYDGYWIWFIPLKEGVISVGAVVERGYAPPDFRTQEGFMKFLNQHRAVREMLEKAELLDFMSFKNLAYGTKRFFSPERWATIGDAGAFHDPFYSPGSDFIGTECDFVTDLIKRDLAGEAKPALDERLEAYEEFMQHRYEATLLLYSQQYPNMGSCEVMRTKLFFDIAAYYNVWLRPYLLDEYTDLEKLKKMLSVKDSVIALMKQYRELFAKMTSALQKRGEYHRMNSGYANGNFGLVVPFQMELGHPTPPDVVDKHTAWIFANTRALARAAIDGRIVRDLREILATPTPPHDAPATN